MRTEGLIFGATAAFFVVIGLIYWFTSYENTGTTLLATAAGLGVLPGAFLLWRSRLMSPRPQDLPDAVQADGAGEMGTFPGPSIWPLTLAGGAALSLVGLVFGIWSALPGGALVVFALIGATAESRRGSGHAG
jgi:hypothetical protein